MKSEAQGIVLAGIHAWGGCILEQICPRPLLSVAGRPLIWYGLEWLRSGGVGRATICANSDTESLRFWLGGGRDLGLSLDYYEDTMPRGPAGCIKDAGEHGDADTFVVLEGTLLPSVDLAGMLAAHRAAGASLTVAVRGQSGRDPNAPSEPVGIYVVSRAALEAIPPRGYQDIKEGWIPRLHEGGDRVVPFVTSIDGVRRVTGIRSYLAATQWAVSTISNGRGWEDHRYSRHDEAWLHPTVQRDPHVILRGPMLIGAGVHLARGVSIVGPAVLGPDSRVERSAVLSGVIASAGCRIGAGAVLSRCVLLRHAEVEADLVMRDAIRGAPASQAAPPAWEEEYWMLNVEPRQHAFGRGLAGATPRLGPADRRAWDRTAPSAARDPRVFSAVGDGEPAHVS
ncbi:MAG: NDP-sugar synthase [Phycisphaerae bacterium]|jgi:mannose-1-phosphate guanylyltransferase/phosphomannomutase